MDKDSVIRILNEIAVLLELRGENAFKSRAYVAAARTLEGLTDSLDKLISEKRLGDIKGIGSALQQKITELVTTGKLPYYEQLKATVPAGLMSLLELPSLGPKKVKVLYEKLGVDSIERLEIVCREGLVARLDGFGEKTQLRILEGIKQRCAYANKVLLSKGIVAAEKVLQRLREHPDVIRCSSAGSLRRFKEILGDLDFLASSKNPVAVIGEFVSAPNVTCVNGQGDTKASVVLEGGVQADLRVVSDAQYPFALAYFTGSKEHNIVMRQRAIARGLRLNEYGLFRSDKETSDTSLLVPCVDEKEIFQELGLAHIPPEMREDKGEFDLAEKDEVPRLIEWTDLRGSLHNHSTWSDGRQSLEEIAQSMEDLGCDYWGITDHSRSSVQARGLTAERLIEQIGAVAEVNRKLADEGIEFRLLSGSEVDISIDANLDFPDEVLAQLDVVVASIHQGFGRSEAEMTRRLIRAAENSNVHILGHLTGRLLLEREAYKVDQIAVIDACAATGTWIELNASPYRLDMDWRLWSYAKSKGVKCVINCDAHRLEHAGFLKLGAGVARKAGLTKKDIVNSLPLGELKRELGKKLGRG